MRELIDAMEDNYSKWRTREGIKNLPEFGVAGRAAPLTHPTTLERIGAAIAFRDAARPAGPRTPAGS